MGGEEYFLNGHFERSISLRDKKNPRSPNHDFGREMDHCLVTGSICMVSWLLPGNGFHLHSEVIVASLRVRYAR